MFHWVSEVSRGQTCQDGRTGCAIRSGTPRKSSPSAGTYLEFEWLHVIRAWSEVSVDQSATAERPTVRVLLQSHAVPLAVATVQTLSVTTCRTTVQTPFSFMSTCMFDIDRNLLYYTTISVEAPRASPQTYCLRAGGWTGWMWCPLILWNRRMSSGLSSDLERFLRRLETARRRCHSAHIEDRLVETHRFS